ncbi:RNA polymerase sigma-70 factor [Sinomicrobium pectinilyticum]|uniref:RNA polymerase sigma-70 factor n=1 Tax=Sinomicrobium pectinilyticum TaxID=1084421 RepID=A0A3N0E3L0_SINP1|nr:RNA polymerase sigma-70 factor [Sinomicrobium pectinilyticum]RNL82383.1 RNA polymerase sigma-70 factor [Sinomicrobium pectinilyticum]
MNYCEDSFLINRLKEGDEKAYVYLIDRYNKRLYGYALSLSDNRAMAEDILQNVFLRTWENRRQLYITSSVQNYLFKSVYNEFINQYKKNRSTMVLEKKYYETLDNITKDMDDGLLESRIKQLKKEIDNLPPKCREAFILSRKEGLTNIEISDYLNISVKTVESHITKAFGILRKRLADKSRPLLFLLLGKVDFHNPYNRKEG